MSSRKHIVERSKQRSTAALALFDNLADTLVPVTVTIVENSISMLTTSLRDKALLRQWQRRFHSEKGRALTLQQFMLSLQQIEKQARIVRCFEGVGRVSATIDWPGEGEVGSTNPGGRLQFCGDRIAKTKVVRGGFRDNRYLIPFGKILASHAGSLALFRDGKLFKFIARPRAVINTSNTRKHHGN